MANSALANPSLDVIDLISNDDHTEYDSDSTLKDDTEEPRPAPNDSSQMTAVCRTVPQVKHQGSTLRAGKNVELRDGDFLRITELLQEIATDKVFLKGHRFRRNVHLKGLLEMKRNEVHQLVRQSSDNSSNTSDYSARNIWFVHLTDFVRVRDLIKTNMLWPANNYKEVEPDYRNFDDQYQKDHFRLVCRWKFLEVSAKVGNIQRLSKDECDIVHSVADTVLRSTFRGHTNEYGACGTWLSGEREFDNTERARTLYRDPLGFYIGDRMALIDLTIDDSDRRYTFGDGFCCSGGTSRGAKGAGLRVSWGFDHDVPAIYSYRKNFVHTDCWAVDAHHFVAMFDDDDDDDAAENESADNDAADNDRPGKDSKKVTAKVDILHLSPPCQTFSPAHTREGQNDERNSASFFALEKLLKTAKPRVVTVEETFGLTRTVDNMPYFRSMIQIFTRIGFSVRWNVFNLRDFGLPQPRKRLFIIASCAGESLPSFPEPTHCDPNQQHLNPNRKPWTTVNQVINQLPAGISLHDPNQMPAIHETPYDGNHPLRTTITCNTGQSWHPSGRRAFTLREIACLQGFPLEHEFGTVGIRKQIGNALPPMVAKLIFETIIKHLKKVDSVTAR